MTWNATTLYSPVVVLVVVGGTSLATRLLSQTLKVIDAWVGWVWLKRDMTDSQAFS